MLPLTILHYSCRATPTQTGTGCTTSKTHVYSFRSHVHSITQTNAAILLLSQPVATCTTVVPQYPLVGTLMFHPTYPRVSAYVATCPLWFPRALSSPHRNSSAIPTSTPRERTSSTPRLESLTNAAWRALMSAAAIYTSRSLAASPATTTSPTPQSSSLTKS